MQVLRSSPHLRWTARSSAPVIVSSRAQGLMLSALLWVTPRVRDVRGNHNCG